MSRIGASILALGMVLGLGIAGWLLSDALITFKTWDRVVTVKGLSEREYLADQVIWPIQFVEAGNELPALYDELDTHAAKVKQFLTQAGISEEDVSVGQPQITDKLAQQYGGGPRAEFRYSAVQTVTVYSDDVSSVREVMSSIGSLLKEGIVLSTQNYNAQTQYVFTRLNEVKPVMIEEATVNAREVALKFASDSQSQLGKIRRANQGRFSISDRDTHHPHIKKVRVVSTIEYTLID